MNELDKQAFWFWFVGFFVAFIPLYLLGFMGAPRRIDHYDASTGWQPLYITAMIGFIIISCGVITQIYLVIESIKQRKQNLDTTGDPWNGRTLEWATHSPPPFYNFAVIPPITSHEVFWDMKKQGWQPEKKYEDIECFKNTGMGHLYIRFCLLSRLLRSFGKLFGLSLSDLLELLLALITLSFDDEMEYVLPAAEVAKIEKSYS